MSHAGVFDAIAPATLARVSNRVPLDLDALAELCRRWQVRELSLFGSVLRDDFGPTSDVDVLVEFLPGAPWSLLDFVTLQDELASRFGRPVDLVERAAVRNPFVRRAIHDTAQQVYAA